MGSSLRQTMGACGGSKEEREAAKDFRKYDKDDSKTMDEAELREFVVAHRHGQLWETIHLNLSIEAERAKDIATFVSFSLAGGIKGGTITMAQFIEFKKNWVDNDQGNQKFMLHTVFSSQDTDQSGFIEEDELDGMANLFFDGSWLTEGDPRMKHFKDKEHFKQIIHDKCDTDKDGKFSFEEMVGVITGQLDYSTDEHTAKDEFADRILAQTAAPLKARHLLIKHEGSRNPLTRNKDRIKALEGNASTASVKKEDAKAELLLLARQIHEEGASEEVFSKHAKLRSDCASYAKGGDLGTFGAGDMQADFEAGCRATAVGKISDIVDSDSGYHIIYRIE